MNFTSNGHEKSNIHNASKEAKLKKSLIQYPMLDWFSNDTTYNTLRRTYRSPKIDGQKCPTEHNSSPTKVGLEQKEFALEWGHRSSTI